MAYSPLTSITGLKVAVPAPWFKRPMPFPLGSLLMLTTHALPVNFASSGLSVISAVFPIWLISIPSITGASPLIYLAWQKSYLKNSQPHEAMVLASRTSLPRLAGRSSQVSVPFEE